VLAFLSQAEIDAALKDVKKRLSDYPRVTMPKVRRLLLQTRKDGHSYWPGLISEAHVVGVPIRSASGDPIGALSCAAIRERLDARRRNRVVALLKAEALWIEKQVSGRKRDRR
jgi:DNA-binding IclR family transcriptional regulator